MTMTHAIIRKVFDYVYDEKSESVIRVCIKTEYLNNYYSLEDARHDMHADNMYGSEYEEYIIVPIKEEKES